MFDLCNNTNKLQGLCEFYWQEPKGVLGHSWKVNPVSAVVPLIYLEIQILYKDCDENLIERRLRQAHSLNVRLKKTSTDTSSFTVYYSRVWRGLVKRDSHSSTAELHFIMNYRLLADSWVFWEPNGTTHTVEGVDQFGYLTWTAMERFMKLQICCSAGILELDNSLVVSRTWEYLELAISVWDIYACYFSFLKLLGWQITKY